MHGRALILFPQRVKRSYFICHGTTSIPASVMQAATGSDLVYFKEYEHGVLYSLYFKHENRKQHSTVENSIQRLDSMLMTKNMTTRTHFTSLTEFGKVKSFSGRDRHDDYHFCEIFDVSAPKRDNGKQYQIQNGVVIWNQSLKDAEEGGYGGLVQKLVFDDGDCVDEDVVCNDVGEGSKSEIEDVKQMLSSTEASLATEKVKVLALLRVYCSCFSRSGFQQETVATLQKENEELKTKIVELESRESQIEAGVVEALQKENEELKKKNASLCTSESVIVSQKTEVKRLELRVRDAKSESANWEEQVRYFGFGMSALTLTGVFPVQHAVEGGVGEG
jgi:FtsZ-binding cell division protein ZapB